MSAHKGARVGAQATAVPQSVALGIVGTRQGLRCCALLYIQAPFILLVGIGWAVLHGWPELARPSSLCHGSPYLIGAQSVSFHAHAFFIPGSALQLVRAHCREDFDSCSRLPSALLPPSPLPPLAHLPTAAPLPAPTLHCHATMPALQVALPLLPVVRKTALVAIVNSRTFRQTCITAV
jgi:hypothetical protein